MNSISFWPLLLLFGMQISCTHIRTLTANDSQSSETISVAPIVLPNQIDAQKKPVLNLTPMLKSYCETIDKRFETYRWPTGLCTKIEWNHIRDSVNGMPLIWTVLGDEESIKKPNTEVTMLMCGVHGDEITPIQFCFDAITYFQQRQELFQGRVLIVAPIVNPDSFFAKIPTRTNASGVDINRNFPTKDWSAKARRYWKDRYSSDKRRNPGTRPLSEPEVVFQVNLVKRYQPDKIISVHAPLTLLDLDGPEISLSKDDASIGAVANELLIQMSQKAKGYKVKNYPFFPGSLGNWAGNERSIPTYTLELPDSDPANSQKFWEMFSDAIHSAVTHPFKVVQKSLYPNTESPSDLVE